MRAAPLDILGWPLRSGRSITQASGVVAQEGKRILVVDDEPMIRQAVRLACETEGYAVDEAADGAEAIATVARHQPDLILLDLVLPDVSGFDVCRQLRREGLRVPIIFLSARSDEIDVVVGLEIGANDYIFKPFRPRELLARVSAHLRRLDQEPSAAAARRLNFRDLVIDLGERRVFRDGKPVELTYKEFDILACLAGDAGRALSRETILDKVWGQNRPAEPRVIDVHVRNLRVKVEADPSRPLHILAVPGIGYRFAPAKPG